jgi:hypothetical protein
MLDPKCVPPILFNKPEVIKELNRLHEEYVLVPADKACNNIVFVWLIIISVLLTNWALILQLAVVLALPTTFSYDEILQTIHLF